MTNQTFEQLKKTYESGRTRPLAWRRAHDDFADVAATGIEDVVERAFQQFAGFLGPAFDHAHGLGVKVLRHQLSKELGRIR